MKRSTIHGLAAATAGLLAAGCGTPYVEPAGGSPITFRNTTPVHLFLMSYAGPVKCTDSQGIGAFPPAGEKTVRVQEGKVATFSAQLLSASSSAGMLTSTSWVHLGSFIPQPGASYSATITASSDQCFLQFTRQNQNGQVEQEQSYVPRTHVNPFLASEGFCSPLSDADRQKLKLP